MFDGDGSIYKGANGINISIITGSKQMHDDLFNAIKKHLHIEMSSRITRELFELRLFSQKNVYKFLSWIYDDNTICLERKYNKFKNADLGQKLQKS